MMHGHLSVDLVIGVSLVMAVLLIGEWAARHFLLLGRDLINFRWVDGRMVSARWSALQ